MSSKYFDSSDNSFDIHCVLEQDVTWLEINIAPPFLHVNKVNNPISPVT